MFCAACGTESSETARFCASCGAAVGRPSRASAARLAARVYTCPSCGAPSVPQSYFSRGRNVAKLILLLPFSMIGPLLFFFYRKDRIICGNCRHLLPQEAHRGLLGPMNLNLTTGASNALALPIVDEEAERIGREGRLHRVRGTVFGMTSAVFAGLAASGDATASLAISGVLAAGSLASLLASSAYGQRAETRRRRHRALRILALAGQHKGRLTVTAVASFLGMDLVEAERALDEMVDGQRIDVEITDDGRVFYVFMELQA